MNPLLILVGLALGAALVYLAIEVIRLRLEVWANRRVITALEQVDHKPPAKRSRLPELLTWAILLLLAIQLIGLVLIR